jgi:hypothetical protein
MAPKTVPMPRPSFAGRVKPSVHGELGVEVAETTGVTALASPLVEVDTGIDVEEVDEEENDEAVIPIVAASTTPFPS